MTDRPHVENAPGLVWRPIGRGWEARWQARTDIVRKGFTPKSERVWCGLEPSAADRAFISDRCQRLQAEMMVFHHGGIPVVSASYDGTLKGLIQAYQTDPDSTYHKMRYGSRKVHHRALCRLVENYGHEEVRDIKARLLLAWHKDWLGDGKVAMAHFFVGRLRTLFSFGATILEDPECERLCAVMHRMRFPMAKSRTERLTAEQATAVRAMANKMGMHSIALAQAFQFELMLRQKDVIGEWVPLTEPGTSDVIAGTTKWLMGLRWSEIDDGMIVRHVTSKRTKAIEVDLKLAGMVMEELALWLKREARYSEGAVNIPVRRSDFPASGPIIVNEYDARPYAQSEFRRKWRIAARAAGIPDNVRNMDSRAGAISEATDAGADLEHVRHAATHGDIAMTQKYSRGDVEKTANVQRIRAEHRNKNAK